MQHAEALVVTLLCILADQVDQRSLVAALRCKDLHPATALRAQQTSERGAVGELKGHIDGARHVGLVEVELLQKGRKEHAR